MSSWTLLNGHQEMTIFFFFTFSFPPPPFLFSEKGLFSSIEKIYKKYIKKLQEESVKEEGCPLCHRCFDSSKQIKSLIAEV